MLHHYKGCLFNLGSLRTTMELPKSKLLSFIIKKHTKAPAGRSDSHSRCGSPIQTRPPKSDKSTQ